MDFLSLINSRHRLSFPLYVFFGQSNMAGKGILEEIPIIERGFIPDSMVWNRDLSQWDTMEVGVNTGNVGEYSAIARFAYLKNLENPSIVNYYYIDAVDGTSMQSRWNTTTPATQSNKDAFDDLQTTGDFDCKEIYWMQGEADSVSLSDANDYQALEADMIDMYKTYYSCDRFITCLLGVDVVQAPLLPYVSTVNAGKTTNFNNNKPSDLITTVDIPKFDDGVHFSSLGLRVLGDRMYDSYGASSIPVDEPFEFTMQTTVSSEQIELPITVDGIGYIDWGDGSPLEPAIEANRMHVYASAGDHVITISSIGHAFYFPTYSSSRDKLIDISKWGINGWNQLIGLSLNNCANLDITATDISQIVNVTKAMNSFFASCPSLVWNSSVANIYVKSSSYNGTFSNSTLFDQPLTNWSGENAILVRRMFANTPYNNPVVNLVDSLCTSVDGVFLSNQAFNYPLTGWDTPNVSLWSNFCSNATAFNQDVSHLDYGSATTLFRFMFLKSPSNYDAIHYTNLLIKWDDFGNGGLNVAGMTDLTINMGTIVHDGSAEAIAARASLVVKGILFTDGH